MKVLSTSGGSTAPRARYLQKAKEPAPHKQLTILEAVQQDDLTKAQVRRYQTVMHETSHLLVGQIAGLTPYELRITAPRSRKVSYVNFDLGRPSSFEIPLVDSKPISERRVRRLKDLQFTLMLMAGVVSDKYHFTTDEYTKTQVEFNASDLNRSCRKLFILARSKKNFDRDSALQEFEAVIEQLYQSKTYKDLVNAFTFRLLDTHRRCVHDHEIRTYFYNFRPAMEKLRKRYVLPFLLEKAYT